MFQFFGFLICHLSCAFQCRSIPAFAAESNGIHNACTVKYAHTACGKGLCTGKGKRGRQQENHIRSVFKGPLDSEILVKHGGLATLNEIPAHYNNGMLSARKLLCGLQVILVPIVEGVVFGYDSNVAHNYIIHHLCPFMEGGNIWCNLMGKFRSSGYFCSFALLYFQNICYNTKVKVCT